MIWYILGATALLFVVFVLYGYMKMKNVQDAPQSNKIKTVNNKNFKTIIRKGLVLVDFWAPWCGPCKMIAPTLNSIAEEQAGNLTIAKVNVDNQQKLAQSYNIRNIPTMILFIDGKEQKRITGIKSKKALLNEIGL